MTHCCRLRIAFLCLLATLLDAAPMTDRSQARSMVISRCGIVASESPLASQAGAAMLAQGGNAVDAAVTANAVMGVVAPMMNGIGGDLFAIVYEAKTGKLYGLNASGWTPKRLSAVWLRGQGAASMPQSGIHSVTVPGAVDGWDKLLTRFGRKPLRDALAPAIRLAEEGFPVSEWVAAAWDISQTNLVNNDNAAATFLPGGHSPAVGQIFSNPDLAASLKLIAAGGRDAFYRGQIAEKIVQCSKSLGGFMTAEDLADYSSEWVEPISTSYRGWTVYELPPNGQGIAALCMLNIMEQFPMGAFRPQSASALHVMIEAKKLAYADMLRYVADPKFASVPVAGLLSKDYARRRAALLDMARAASRVPPGQPPGAGRDTTYLCVVDRDGNMVSYIQSNYEAFGSGIVPGGAGFALQNRGALFSLDAESPNVLAGRKRPLHTIIPGFMAKGDIRAAFGIMGGFNQAQAHAQFVSDIVDDNMNIQAALEAPRFTKGTFEGRDVQIEDRVPAAVRAQLKHKGHQIRVRGDYSSAFGGGQAVMRDFTAGVNYGASDPRKDGAAIPEP
ncbi:MAG TPA: gamma-glutamyltransferase [Verrucomicrobiae bacterium]|jgi:gamma-glutamyltranspeptidase/glutathione hydrolase